MVVRQRFSFKQVRDVLGGVLEHDLHAKRVELLCNATLGVLHSASLAVCTIGQGLAAARSLKLKHAVKQVDRLLSNPSINVDAILARWVPYIIGARTSIVVALDWTDFDADNQATIMLALISDHGRSTPLVWLTVDKDTLKDHRSLYEHRGMPGVASGLSVNISLVGSTLTASMQISATQSKGGETSAPYPFPETVCAAPAPSTGLPAVVFLSGLHPCVDWIFMGGTIPGATVEIRYHGKRVGTALATGSAVSVPISFSEIPAPGDMLEALQTFTTQQGVVVRGPTTPSLPLQGRPHGEPPAPSVQSPFECDLAVLVSGLQEGISLVVKHTDDELAGYPFVGTPVWAQLRNPVRLTDVVSARQRMIQCHGDSPFSAPPVGAVVAPKLPTPVIVGPICPNAAILRVRNLRPGANVVVFANRVTTNGSSGTQVGQATAWATDCDFALPPGWANVLTAPGQLEIEIWQENCGKGSDPARYPAQPLPALAGQPSMQTPVECARVVAVSSLTAGAYVIVTSDQADWPQLSGPIFVTSANMPLGLNRPLRAGEHVQVRQAGCSVGADSASTKVAAFSGVAAPVVTEPVRIPHGGVTVRNLIVGARVHVFVNGAPTASVDVTAPEMFIPLPPVGRETQIWARQSLCTKISKESNHATATLGQMAVSFTPSPIVRGKPTSITVTATDFDNRQPVNGQVTISAAIVGATGTPFAFTFAAGPSPASEVKAADYDLASIIWSLVDAPPQPAAMLHLSLSNQATSFYTITSVAWSIERQELDGSFTLVGSPTGQTAAVHPPSNGQYHVYASVSVDDLINGGNVVAEFRGNVTVHGLSTLLVVWTNVDLSHAFRLISELQVVWAGGSAYTIYNPVVLS